MTRAPGRRRQARSTPSRLTALETARWKRVLDVQRPYRWNLERLHLGRTLDVGCGIGRNLQNLGPDAVGVDHNAHSIEICRQRGLTAYTDAGVPRGIEGAARDVRRHAAARTCSSTSARRWPTTSSRSTSPTCGREARSSSSPPGGRVPVRRDPRAVGGPGGRRGARARHGMTVVRSYSFPFPRPVGKVFKYNEFVTVARKPEPPSEVLGLLRAGLGTGEHGREVERAHVAPRGERHVGARQDVLAETEHGVQQPGRLGEVLGSGRP